MDEDDEFGDLYADLGGGEEPEAPADAAGAAGGSGSAKIGFAVEEEDEGDDELYGGFGKTDGKRGDEGTARAEASFTNGSVKEKPPSRVEDSEEGGSGRFQENGGEGSESDSDDDLQIVLNNDKPAPSEPEPATGESNEETEDVPAANQPWAEEQQPAQLEAPPPQPQIGVPAGVLPPGLLPSDQVSKPNVPNASALPRPPGKPFIQQHHAQYKYVRGPMIGGPMNSTPVVVQGLGRGYPPGAWGPGKGPPIGVGQQRPWSGPPGFPHSDIHLPPTKTVFDMDLDALEDKPWRHANVDVTDYFNFGFTESSWKQYCQQLSQLRLEATMQSKISVYESGRSEQPIGRAIQVEGGVGERRPSYDVRRNRNRDSNDVIEIVLQDAVEETPIPIADRMEMNDGNDYDGTLHDQDVGEPSSRGGPMLGRNGPFMEDGPPFFPMGPRPRGPYRMFPGGPFGPGRGGVMRPPFYEPGMPPLPMHMRPDGYPLGDFGEPPRRGTSGSMGPSRNPSQGRMALEEEHSSGSVAVKDDRKHADSSKDYKDDRRSKTNRDHGKEEEDEKSDEQKRSSDDKHDQAKRQKRYPESHSRSQKDGRKKESASDLERSSYSGEEDPKSRHRSREGDHEHSWQKKPPPSDEKDRRQEKEKDLRKEEEWARRSHREREEARWKEEDLRRASRNRDDDISRRREDDGRKRDKVDEHWQRKEREESWRRDRDDAQKRRSGYDDSYERKEREDERSGHSDRSKRHSYDKAPADSRDEEEYLRRKSKHDSQRRDYRDARQYEDDHYDHRKSGAERSSSRGGREQEDERLYKDKYGWTSRSKDADSRRNGSTSEHLDDRLDKKKRKSEYQKSGGHAEKVQHEGEATTAASSEKKNPKPTSRIETYHNRTEDSYSSDGDEDGKHRKGRSKMERLNRERPLTEENAGRYSSSSGKRQDKDGSSAQGKHSGTAKGVTENSSKTVNGDNKQEPDSFAKRRERFMQAQKVEPSERKPVEKAMPQADNTEFKHERPARKRRWGS